MRRDEDEGDEPRSDGGQFRRRPMGGEAVRWGIIGCGDVTEVKSGPAFQKAAGSALVAVMRRDGAKARDYAERHDVPRWSANADAIVGDPEVDAVYVATPPSSHAEYVRRAAAAGKPVYVEKPMGMTALECEGMIRACERGGVPLFVAYYRRLLPRFTKVERILADGTIGEPRFVRATLRQPAPSEREREGWRFDPEIAGGGLFVDLGSHVLDLFDAWFGPVRDVHGSATTRLPGKGVEDGVTASFVFDGGVQGVGVWDFAGVGRQDEAVVIGSHGIVSVPMFDEGPIVVVDARGRETRHSVPHPPHVQQPLVQSVTDELLGRGTCPSTGSSAARTQAVVDAILAEHRRRRLSSPER